MKIYIGILLAMAVIGGGVWFALSGNTESKEETEYKDEVTIKDTELDTIEPLELLEKVKEMEYVKYDSTMTFPGGEQNSSIWLSGSKIRIESNMDGQTVIVLMDEDKGEAVLYVPTQGFATKMNTGESTIGQGTSMIDQTIELLKENHNVVGTEEIDGKNCLVVEYESELSDGTMWIWTSYGLPLKVEMETTEGTTTVTASNVRFEKFSDDVFELPSGIEITDTADFQ